MMPPLSWSNIRRECIQVKTTAVPSVTTLVAIQIIWRCTWGFTLERGLTAAQCVTTLAPPQSIWRYTWESTLGKNLTAVPSVTILALNHLLWAGIWESTQEISPLVVLNVPSVVLTFTFWRNTSLQGTMVRNPTAAINAITLALELIILRHIWNYTQETKNMLVAIVIIPPHIKVISNVTWESSIENLTIMFHSDEKYLKYLFLPKNFSCTMQHMFSNFHLNAASWRNKQEKMSQVRLRPTNIYLQ